MGLVAVNLDSEFHAGPHRITFKFTGLITDQALLPRSLAGLAFATQCCFAPQDPSVFGGVFGLCF